MKKIFAICFALLALVVIGSSTHSLASHYLDHRSVPATPKCAQAGKLHKVVITDSKVQPEHTTAKLCDILTITNTDDQIRLMAFGEHDNHQAYDGVIEKVLQKGQSLTVTLNKPGSYQFHDHLDESVQGTFSVN
ncbi:MAG TPA: cupredoxin domain-containing protein [Candidatus Saccharimonadales bacterium]|nr:cupredoxin domain-containing protein [Candidatus Saccharimonadales bacterium]